MPTITPRELAYQLRETVEVIALPASAQVAWLERYRFPVDEIYLQFDDEVPRWFPRLQEAGLMTERLSLRLKGLLAEFESMSGKANHYLWRDDDSLLEPRWEVVRVRAREALAEFDIVLAEPSPES